MELAIIPINQDICVTPLFLGVTMTVVITLFEIFNMILMDWIGLSIRKVKSKLDEAEAEIAILTLNNQKLQNKNEEYESNFTDFIDRLEAQITEYENEIAEFKTKLEISH
jgi:phage shock protein A